MSKFVNYYECEEYFSGDSDTHSPKGMQISLRRMLPVFNSLSSNEKSVRNWETTKGKRALLCAVTYNKQKYKRKASNDDVISMRELLISRFQFPRSSIRILAEMDPYLLPTKRNIQEALKWLVRNNQPGDSLVFYFSGHALRQPDFLDDELDGFNETICPLDFTTSGMIVDNEINDTIVRPLKNGVKLHAIIDACHSETILDLPVVYRTNQYDWFLNSHPSGVYKGTSGAHVVSLSMNEDDQLAADTSAYSLSMEGAMTYAFRKALLENRLVTYASLLASMQASMQLVTKKKCCSLPGLFYRGIQLQEPVLSSSKVFDVNKPFVL